jgi:type II secretory pathway pseudopilin PulG
MLNARPQVILVKQVRRPVRDETILQALWSYFCERAGTLVVLGIIALMVAVTLPPMLRVQGKVIAVTAEVCAHQLQAVLQTQTTSGVLNRNALSSCTSTSVSIAASTTDPGTYTVRDTTGLTTYTVTADIIRTN